MKKSRRNYLDQCDIVTRSSHRSEYMQRPNIFLSKQENHKVKQWINKTIFKKRKIKRLGAEGKKKRGGQKKREKRAQKQKKIDRKERILRKQKFFLQQFSRISLPVSCMWATPQTYSHRHFKANSWLSQARNQKYAQIKNHSSKNPSPLNAFFLDFSTLFLYFIYYRKCTYVDYYIAINSRSFAPNHANYYCRRYLMQQDLSNFNYVLEDQDEFHLTHPTQYKTTRKSSFDIKQVESCISPANIPFNHKAFLMQSPTPFKQNFSCYYQQQQSENYNRENQSVEPQKNRISTVVNFEQSPKKKNFNNFQLNTASSCRISQKDPPLKIHNAHNKQDKKGSKGLRNLSQSVYEIVLQQKITTYKQVADQLVKQHNLQDMRPQEDQMRAKDEQNIKRRVYDALNVLISAGVLKKEGKEVMSQRDTMSEKMRSSKNQKKQDKDNLHDQILRKKVLIEEKKQKIQQLKNKKQVLNAILKRNKKKKVENEKIMFPLVGFVYNRQIPKLNRNENNSKITLPVSNCIQMIGDIDILMKIGIDVLNQKIEEIIEDVNEEDVESEDLPKRKSKAEQSQSKQKVSRVLYSL